MYKRRAFKIQAVPATNTKPTRVKITDLRFAQSVVINYGATSASTMNERAIEYLNSQNIFIDSQAWAENKDGQHQYTLLLTTNFTDKLI